MVTRNKNAVGMRGNWSRSGGSVMWVIEIFQKFPTGTAINCKTIGTRSGIWLPRSHMEKNCMGYRVTSAGTAF
jgi:hypothetical protein